jgi:hypothetical protein
MYNQNVPKKATFFYWLPRALGILLIGFLALFAFDVFVSGEPFLKMIGAFLIHLLPNYLLAAALLIAWKREELGGFLLILLGIFFTLFFRTYTAIPNFLIVSAPVFVIGILFLVHTMFYQKEVN